MYTGPCDSCGEPGELNRLEVADEDGMTYETFLVCEECEPISVPDIIMNNTRQFILQLDSPEGFITWN